MPTVPETTTTLSVGGDTSVTTATTQPATTVTRSTDGMASTGPHDYVWWVSLAGVFAVATGVSMRGRRADGSHWR
ncbi:MAG TPA: hypothetical protein VHD87_18025 [Acidimicrobiales bacterium]|nr:hypothetical protein [Acidimicrobiales bacterium]